MQQVVEAVVELLLGLELLAFQVMVAHLLFLVVLVLLIEAVAVVADHQILRRSLEQAELAGPV
jgi:hypothetical protein